MTQYCMVFLKNISVNGLMLYGIFQKTYLNDPILYGFFEKHKCK